MSAAREVVEAFDLFEVGEEISGKVKDAAFGCERYLLALAVAVGNRKREDESSPVAPLAADVAENDHLIATEFLQGEGELVVPTARESDRLGRGTTLKLCRDGNGLLPTISVSRVLARRPERCDRRGNGQDAHCAYDKDG